MEPIQSPSQILNRRHLLKRVGLSAAGALGLPLLSGSSVRADATTQPAAKRALRVAHLTDVHVQPERGAGEGLVQCLHHVQSQAEKPDLIVITGDCVFDSFGKDRARTQLQWDLWTSIFKNECSVPVMPLLGNHDIWGWNKKKSTTTGSEPGWGKKFACDVLALEKPYYSFDRGGWHFVMLDSVQPWAERNYTAHLDEEQMAWLKSDLAANAGKPTFISSHIPIFSITPIMGQKAEEQLGKNGERNSTLGHAVMHTDWRDIKALFKQHRDVKLAVSGHMHLVDRVDYGGVSYMCNGAVSGGWWKQAHLGEGDAGYAMLNLNSDGSFDREYVTYGWKYRDVPAPTEAAAAPAAG